jgi:hypothetical protein
MAKVKSKRAYWGIMGASALSMLLTLGGGMSYSEPHAAAQFRAEVPMDAAPAPQCVQGKAVIAIAFVAGQKGDTGETQCFCGAQEVAKATANTTAQTPDGMNYGVSAGSGTQGSGAQSSVSTPNPQTTFAGGICLWEQ